MNTLLYIDVVTLLKVQQKKAADNTKVHLAHWPPTG